MVKKKVDSRIRTLIENGIATNHRSFFVMVGDNGKDQVPNLHYILSKSVVKARPSVLWCYKEDLGFSKHKKKKMRQKEKSKSQGLESINQEDPFDVFISTTNIRYSYYSESHKILGQTFGMLVLQDFEAITPNLLARTIETVEGGGIVVLLLKTMTSLKQLYTMSMDVHSRFRQENSRSEVVCRFNERFLLSLAKCEQCLVMDDELNILPLSSHSRSIEAKPTILETPEQIELKQFKQQVKDTEVAGVLIENTKTMDQATALLTFIDSISEKTLRSTVTLTAGRGRGKSAALGLAISAAVAFGYSNIFVSSPTPENLHTLFQFIFKGFDSMEYVEHVDYELVKSTNPEFHDAIIRVNIFRTHRQTIQYIQPQDYQKLGQAELVVIDEAAAIPLPYVKNLLGPYLVFMSSTINGYEGTGRSLSLKLIKQLRDQSTTVSGSSNNKNITGRVLREVELNEPIRYSSRDPIEKWLNELLCLDSTVAKSSPAGCPHPSECQLYYVNRDTLFSYHKASELFLQKMVGLFVSSHYKNSPNDLLLMSDAPDHHLFVLLGPVDENSSNGIPEILCAVQVSLEGEIAKESILSSIKRGYQASGDLIPWTLTQQYQDEDFPRLSGARVVRIATHPDYQKMGYGSKALDILTEYYQGKIPNLDEDNSDDEDNEKESDKKIKTVEKESVSLLSEVVKPRANIPPLLFKLSERKPEKLHYMGVSYGVTQQLYQFWSKSKYLPVYLRLTSNDITGEHTCIMLRELNNEHNNTICQEGWLQSFHQDFRKRFINLLGYEFRNFNSKMALNILFEKEKLPKELSYEEVKLLFSSYDLKRLESYSNNIVDYHVVIDLLPSLAKLYFTNKLKVEDVSLIQSSILLALGLQHKTVDDLMGELNLQSNQILSLFNQTMRKLNVELKSTQDKYLQDQLPKSNIVAPRTGQYQSFKGDIKDTDMIPLAEDLESELEKGADEIKAKFKKQLENDESLQQYLIKGDDDQWKKALNNKSAAVPKSISIKTKEVNKLTRFDEVLEYATKKGLSRKEFLISIYTHVNSSGPLINLKTILPTPSSITEPNGPIGEIVTTSPSVFSSVASHVIDGNDGFLAVESTGTFIFQCSRSATGTVSSIFSRQFNCVPSLKLTDGANNSIDVVTDNVVFPLEKVYTEFILNTNKEPIYIRFLDYISNRRKLLGQVFENKALKPNQKLFTVLSCQFDSTTKKIYYRILNLPFQFSEGKLDKEMEQADLKVSIYGGFLIGFGVSILIYYGIPYIRDYLYKLKLDSTKTVTPGEMQGMCSICYEKSRDMVFIPCNHVIACNNCSDHVTFCPVCRGHITQKRRIIFS
ncbi:hypothetical protein DICPUDRAFT_149730 [Dictyostelium purpureum]|uniref:RNA cytidine acetyltransferase n=1 Tax=Dictyostelium purpureum TaxID=5786 RepID=F0ZEI7_DICPU|nr:uncharacterized protein DICPUDRAFT_149730 [Dictyostelium purpureum]EGC37654.1 hypothetical protein DICPUDRAFT_149730 [Dictyostelium purpureum]|eukprot:XP_003285842.1 hypothetical protein DICPUDRAFT_149730 [Dictyostelium purpureum]